MKPWLQGVWTAGVVALCSQRKLLAVGVLLAMLGALAASGASLASPVEIERKRTEAEQVLAQIEQIDGELGLAIEAYKSASIRLEEIEEDIRVTQRHLGIARRAYKTAQKNLADRIVALYISGEQDVLEVILGSASLDDLIDRLDSVRRISAEDVRIIETVRESRRQIRDRAEQLAKARREQQKIVAGRAGQREAIEAKLAERAQLYDSIKDQIAHLEAEERERQRRLAEEARRRLEEERAAERAEQAAAASSSDSGSAAEAVPSPMGISNAPSTSYGSQIVDIAMRYLGVPYVWGGASPSQGFDCSGLVLYAYAQIGISVPHYTGSLWQMGVPVARDALEPGDLVFFNNLGHMGIYIGGGQMVAAPHTGDVVKVSDITTGSYASSYVGARRI